EVKTLQFLGCEGNRHDENRSDRHTDNLISAAAANAEVLIRTVCANISSRPEASGFNNRPDI
ncbi:hypothetical protein, partial [Vreelandella glaciei]|uniref:hypothetical protein n=1 Tax=Vreelandella glaciei TaxID=186761 RepID=UPI0030023D4A